MHPMPASFLPFFLLAPALDGWLGVYLDGERDEAVVVECIPDSPAARAGLRAGDVLLAIGDQATPTREAFSAAIRVRKAGERVRIQVRRDGAEQVVVVELGRRPDEPAPSAEPGRPARPAAPGAEGRVGDRRGYLGISAREQERGVVVERVLDGSPAARAGVRAGEIVTSIDGTRVDGLVQLDEVLQRARPGQRIALGVQGDGGARTLNVTLAERPGQAGGVPVTAAPVEPVAPTREGRAQAELEGEIAALRAEITQLRRELEELRRAKGRE